MLSNEDDMAKELQQALKDDFPNARLKHAPHGAQPSKLTVRADLDQLIAKLETMIEVFKALKAQL
jgi:hypothetical protein